MEIIVPKAKPPRAPYLRALALVAVTAALVAAAVAYFRPAGPADLPPPPAAPEDAVDVSYRERIQRIERELEGMTQALYRAEEFGDRAKYMEIARAAAARSLDADALWYEWRAHTEREGAVAEGMEQALFEGWKPVRFTERDKFELLAAEHGVTPDTVRALKAQIEVLFWEELADKFAPPSEEGPQAPGTATSQERS